jgi:hypothetical protein
MLSWPAISGRPAALPDWLFIWSITVTGPNRVFHFTICVNIFLLLLLFREEGTMMRNKGEQDSEAMSCPSWQARHLRATRWFKVNRNRADAPWKQTGSTGIKQTHHGSHQSKGNGVGSLARKLSISPGRSGSPARHLLARRTVAAPFSSFQHGRSFTVPAAQGIKHPYEIQNSKVVLPYGTLLWSQRLQIQFLKEGEKISM